MKRLLAPAALAFSLLAVTFPAGAQALDIPHPDPKVEARLKSVAEELRCLVCQNQTIADSNAPLALDLRQQVRKMIADGKSDDEIRAYMVARYGDFVLYKPPFKPATALLWLGPGLLIVAGFAGMFLMIRRRRDAVAAAAPPDGERLREIEKLLAAEDEPAARR